MEESSFSAPPQQLSPSLKIHFPLFIPWHRSHGTVTLGAGDTHRMTGGNSYRLQVAAAATVSGSALVIKNWSGSSRFHLTHWAKASG